MNVLAALRLVIVTDRGPVPLDRLAALLDAAPPGTALVQLRDKQAGGAALFATAAAIVAIARPRGAAVLINDRLDVALAAGADGVHLPEDGLDIATARAVAASVGRTILIGCSRHAPTTAAAASADGADLVLLGPIFATPGKPSPLGLSALTAARAAMTGAARLCAIGGIEDAQRAAEARAAGADAVAAIRALWRDDDPASVIRTLT